MIKSFLKNNNEMFLSKNFISGFDPLKPKQHIPFLESDSHCGDCGNCKCSSRPQKYFNDKSIVYKYNNYGYRSDDFSTIDAKDNVLYSGCSVTFGSGLNAENSWPYYLNSLLNKNKLLNLSICGASYKHIFFDIFNYIDTFGNPPAIFILFPNLERYPLFIEYSGDIRLSCSHYMFDKKDGSKFQDVLSDDSVMFDFISQIRMLEKYCQESNILLRWGTWDYSLDNKLKDLKNINDRLFVSYVEMLVSDSAANIFSDLETDQDSNKEFWRLSRDGHPGIKEQKMFAQIFKNSLGEHFL